MVFNGLVMKSNGKLYSVGIHRLVERDKSPIIFHQAIIDYIFHVP